jgi:hypothetical protein
VNSFSQQIEFIGLPAWWFQVKQHVLNRLVPIDWTGFAHTRTWPGYWTWFWHAPDGPGRRAVDRYVRHVADALYSEPPLLKHLRRGPSS